VAQEQAMEATKMLGADTGYDLTQSLTCGEADLGADLIAVFGDTPTPFLLEHACQDVDGDLHLQVDGQLMYRCHYDTCDVLTTRD
jgi:hypothetical protein